MALPLCLCFTHSRGQTNRTKTVSKLKEISLAENQLTTVMDADTFEGFAALRNLTLDGNALVFADQNGDGSVASLFNLPHLQQLYLRNCSLEGLPVGLFANLSGLLALDLSGNPFTEVSIRGWCCDGQ